MNVHRVVTSLFKAAVSSAYPSFPRVNAEVAVKARNNYTCVTPKNITKLLRKSGVKTTPTTVANIIVDSVPSNTVIDKCAVSDDGAINITLNQSFVSDILSDMTTNGLRPPATERQLRVVVDYSSPNVAKEMHVGHLRSTIIGETICRLLEYVGHQVVRLNHVGDWGTQFGMVLAHLKDTLPDFQTVKPSATELSNIYKEAKQRSEKDEGFKTQAHNEVVKLQNGDPQTRRAWEAVCDISRKENQSIYQRLGVTIEERGESFYQPLMPLLVADLENKDMVVERDGCKLVFVEGHKVPLTIVKSNGAYTYDTSDLAAVRHRVEKERGDWLIYVVDSGQELHFKTVFAAARKAGYVSDATRLDHMDFGLVLGTDNKKFKSRCGDYVGLKELLDEGLKFSSGRIKQSKKEEALTEAEYKAVHESIAYGCIKYAELSHRRSTNYVFSFDNMFDDRGNTAVHLLYTYTRIRSIFRLAGITAETFQKQHHIVLSHEREWKLANSIIRFPEVISSAVEDLMPHLLCSYLNELCDSTSKFYSECYCINSDPVSGNIISVNYSRIMLLEAVRLILKQSFDILGIDAVEKM